MFYKQVVENFSGYILWYMGSSYPHLSEYDDFHREKILVCYSDGLRALILISL